MLLIKLLRLNEWHPGAKEIDESIEYFIKRGEEMGISREDLMEAIKRLIEYHEQGTAEQINIDSPLSKAILHIETAIETMIDDGWHTDWIYRELTSFLSDQR